MGIKNTDTHAQIHDVHIHLEVCSSTFRLQVAANLVSLEPDYVVNNPKLMKNKAALHGT